MVLQDFSLSYVCLKRPHVFELFSDFSVQNIFSDLPDAFTIDFDTFVDDISAGDVPRDNL